MPLFLSLDGIDGAGKSTQCRLLADWLRGQGHEVVECADPGGTPVGDELRHILLNHRLHLSLPCEALLFMASRAQLVADVIRPALDSGKSVVCDRFLLANVVYQGHAGGLDPEELWRVGRLATGGLAPDLTIVLDLPLEGAGRRRKAQADRLESRDTDYHERVRQGFLEEARRRPEKIIVVDASGAAERAHEMIRNELTRRWGKMSDRLG
ncbi:MAG: dTMP kinase [Gemmataceae bacterium]